MGWVCWIYVCFELLTTYLPRSLEYLPYCEVREDSEFVVVVVVVVMVLNHDGGWRW